jgi:hypothetical protein
MSLLLQKYQYLQDFHSHQPSGLDRRGALEGLLHEFDNGDTGPLVFCGWVHDNLRQGSGMIVAEGGGLLVGNFEQGVADGPGAFIWPDGSSWRGKWSDGDLDEATYMAPPAKSNTPSPPCSACEALAMWDAHRTRYFKGTVCLVRASPCAHTIFVALPPSGPIIVCQARFQLAIDLDDILQSARLPKKPKVLTPQIRITFEDSATASPECLSLAPLLADPYETARVYVAPSTIAGAAEGLFAETDLPSEEIVAFYTGCLVAQNSVDSRPWARNANTISLTTTVAIDVPAPWDSVAVYCASLGHKANHTFAHPPNARYDTVFHPRWGGIKCVRTCRPVAAGEELLVDYGYGKAGGPQWYRDARDRHQQGTK